MRPQPLLEINWKQTNSTLGSWPSTMEKLSLVEQILRLGVIGCTHLQRLDKGRQVSNRASSMKMTIASLTVRLALTTVKGVAC